MLAEFSIDQFPDDTSHSIRTTAAGEDDLSDTAIALSEGVSGKYRGTMLKPNTDADSEFGALDEAEVASGGSKDGEQTTYEDAMPHVGKMTITADVGTVAIKNELVSDEQYVSARTHDGQEETGDGDHPEKDLPAVTDGNASVHTFDEQEASADAAGGPPTEGGDSGGKRYGGDNGEEDNGEGGPERSDHQPERSSVEICEAVAKELGLDKMLEGNLAAAIERDIDGSSELVREFFPQEVELHTAEVSAEDTPKLLVAGNIADRQSALQLRAEIMGLEEQIGDPAFAAGVTVGELYANNQGYVQAKKHDYNPRIVGVWELPRGNGYLVTQHTLGEVSKDGYRQEAENLNPTDPDYDPVERGRYGKERTPDALSIPEHQLPPDQDTHPVPLDVEVSPKVPFADPANPAEASAEVDLDALLENVDPEAFAAMQEFGEIADATAGQAEEGSPGKQASAPLSPVNQETEKERDEHREKSTETGRGHAWLILNSQKQGMMLTPSRLIPSGIVVLGALMRNDLLPDQSHLVSK